MPNLPPFSRSEKITDYKHVKSVLWREEQIEALDGTRLSIAIGENSHRPYDHRRTSFRAQPQTIVAYFQGNGSSIPSRLPNLSKVLDALNRSHGMGFNYSVAALSYRGFWTSSGRPSKPGIEEDAMAFLDWIARQSETYDTAPSVILWGQSMGSAVAVYALRTLLDTQSQRPSRKSLRIVGLILETPFTSIKDMLAAIYPQKWLPYGHLHHFLWNRWDNEREILALKQLTSSRKPDLLILQAGKDELVPVDHAVRLQRACRESGFVVELTSIPGAFHTSITNHHIGRLAIENFILKKTVSPM